MDRLNHPSPLPSRRFSTVLACISDQWNQRGLATHGSPIAPGRRDPPSAFFRHASTLLTVLTVLTLLAQASAQEDQESSRVRGMWKAEMPAGTYLVRLDAITSISRHEYLVDGIGRVAEVNLSASGPAMVRFYQIEPIQAQAPGGVGQSALNLVQEKAREAVARAGAEEVWRSVVKSYPTATHAHTIEYRLESREALDKLFSSLERAFTTGRPGSFKP